jgi:hypothetical protein
MSSGHLVAVRLALKGARFLLSSMFGIGTTFVADKASGGGTIALMLYQ